MASYQEVDAAISGMEEVMYNIPGWDPDIGPTGYVMDYEYDGFLDTVSYQVNYINRYIADISGYLVSADAQLNAMEAEFYLH